MNELVHSSDSLVIFLQAHNLLIEELLLLVTHLEVRLQALNISTELLILICKLHVEVLLEVQVTLHICDFTVPEVELISLLGVILFHEGDTSVHIPLRVVFLLDFDL